MNFEVASSTVAQFPVGDESRQSVAEENQFVKAFGFQRSEKSLQVCIQVRTLRWQANRLHALASQASTERLAESRIAIHDQALLALDETVFAVGQFAGNCLDPFLSRIGGTASKVDAASFELHDKEKIECCQSTLCPNFDGPEIDRSHHIPV